MSKQGVVVPVLEEADSVRIAELQNIARETIRTSVINTGRKPHSQSTHVHPDSSLSSNSNSDNDEASSQVKKRRSQEQSHSSSDEGIQNSPLRSRRGDPASPPHPSPDEWTNNDVPEKNTDSKKASGLARRTRALPDQEVAEKFVDTLAGALESFGLTDSAKEILERGFQDTVDVDASQVITELRKMTESPVQGILEANRIGALGKMYKTADRLLDSLLTDLDDGTMLMSKKIQLLDMLLGKIKLLSTPPDGAGASGNDKNRRGLRAGEAELSETRTVRVNLTERAGKRKADELLGYTDRPGDDFLDA